MSDCKVCWPYRKCAKCSGVERAKAVRVVFIHKHRKALQEIGVARVLHVVRCHAWHIAPAAKELGVPHYGLRRFLNRECPVEVSQARIHRHLRTGGSRPGCGRYPNWPSLLSDKARLLALVTRHHWNIRAAGDEVRMHHYKLIRALERIAPEETKAARASGLMKRGGIHQRREAA